MRLGEILIEMGSLDREILEEALVFQKNSGKLLGKVLIEYQFCEVEEVLEGLLKQMQMGVDEKR